MGRSQGYLQYFALLLLLALYSIEPVSSRKCYACNSDMDVDCISAANNKSKFIVECRDFGHMRSSFNLTLNKQDTTTKTAVDYDCAYAKGIATHDGRTIVVRGCAVKPVTCDTYKTIYAVGDAKGNGLQIDSCKRCDSDLCNSSGHLNIGMWTLSLSLLSLYFIKH